MPINSAQSSRIYNQTKNDLTDGASGLTYTIQPGDTLASIAKAHGIELELLCQANPNILNPDCIYSGERINLPACEKNNSSKIPNIVEETLSSMGEHVKPLPEKIARLINNLFSGKGEGVIPANKSDREVQKNNSWSDISISESDLIQSVDKQHDENHVAAFFRKGDFSLRSRNFIIQRIIGAQVDGIVGPKTIKKINEYLSAAPSCSQWSVGQNARHQLISNVHRGLVTYNAEGNDNPSSRYFSRAIHWPGNHESGVTIGRGYDMGGRTLEEIFTDLRSAGVPEEQARAISSATGLKGESARNFVNVNRDIIGTITRQQQAALFEKIYPLYVQKAEENYDHWTASQPSRTEWNELQPAIRDILTDFVYQGFTRGPRPMLAGMHNDVDELVQYIRNSESIAQYEPGRKRADYLERSR